MKLLFILLIIYFILQYVLNNKFIRMVYNIQWYLRLSVIIIPIITLYFFPDLYDKVKESLDKIDSLNKIPNVNTILNLVINKSLSNSQHLNHFKQNKRNVSESKKKYVAANQQWKCKDCNNLLDATYEIDHIVPLYKGGNNDVSNLSALCRNCHGKKTLNDRIFS
jgi:5-methylcytosine-specific restriction enzyme A